MDLQLQTALIAAAVGIATALVASLGAWRLERRKWITGLKTALQVEVQKARMQHYPSIFAIMGLLSSTAEPPLTSASAKDVAVQLSDWIYSAGGLTAEASTRGAILGLPQCLRRWNRTETRPEDFYTWRNLSLLLLRRDVDVSGLESYDEYELGPLLANVRREADIVNRRAKRNLKLPR